jgi:hypothetical protein
MLTIALVMAAASLEIEIAGGVAKPLDPEFGEGPAAVGLQARVGVDLLDHVTLSLGLLGVPGPKGRKTISGFAFESGAAFRAISGHALVRLHTAGSVQGFLEAGLGPGHLISLAAEDHFENPPEHGRSGISLWLGGGGRWFVSDGFAVGVTAAWTSWSNVSRPGFVYGATDIPASTKLRPNAVLLLFDVGWSRLL